MLGSHIYEMLFYLVPILSLVLFAASLYFYCYAKYRNKRAPGTFSEEQMRKRKIFLIIASIIAGVLLVVVIGFIALLVVSIAFM